MSLTLVIVINAILCGAVVAVIVGSHLWAIATQHRDWLGRAATPPSSHATPMREATPAPDPDEAPQQDRELALV